MKSVETAPLIKAVVVGKGADFSNYPDGEQDGEPWMHQVSKHLLQFVAINSIAPDVIYNGIVWGTPLGSCNQNGSNCRL